MKPRTLIPIAILALVATSAFTALRETTAKPVGSSWTPLDIEDDPLLRMPGTQPADGIELESPNICLACHANYDPEVEPGNTWRGSMMANAGRDPLFWAAFAVAAQDSIWFLDRPNATDMCMRCHMPAGWLGGRSAVLNGSAMTGSDFDGLTCDFCHRMYDPFSELTFNGKRESDDFSGYWDEPQTGLLTENPATEAAWYTYLDDQLNAETLRFFNGNPFYGADGLPVAKGYRENSGGQYYVSFNDQKRASFVDAEPPHKWLYSRYHKSKFFCATCHDVSNPVLANLPFEGTTPGDGTTELTTETESPAQYAHVERTFSEFMLSAYGEEGGAPGVGPYAPDVFETSRPGNNIASCQDCHLPDAEGKGCRFDVIVRPDGSREHPKSGQPVHDLTGGNMWVPYILASTVPGSPNYDAFNDAALNQGPAVLTLDLTQGLGVEPNALLAAVDRAQVTLQRAAAIENVNYNSGTGDLSFRIQNQTGHKLITGYIEGRRMFVNVKAYQGKTLLGEINPFDDTIGTLKGLPLSFSPNSPPLGAGEQYVDELVYECTMSSSITGESKSQHFILSTDRTKDNRIPPKGFRIADALDRIAEPVANGVSAPGYFTNAEYTAGADDVAVSLPAGADRIEIGLYYQTVSREYAEFLRDEIKGTGNLTLPPEAYIAQTDPFFDQLRAWGTTIWQLWSHNKNVPGAQPVEMTQTVHIP